MEYVYLGLAALVAIMFVYKKITNGKKTDEFTGTSKKKQ